MLLRSRVIARISYIGFTDAQHQAMDMSFPSSLQHFNAAAGKASASLWSDFESVGVKKYAAIEQNAM